MNTGDPTPPSRRREFLRWLVALLTLRVLTFTALFEGLLVGEELEKGAVAKALLDGLLVPYHALPYHLFEGGGFVVCHLKAASFALLGESMLAHRLVGLVTCALVFAAYWRLLDHHFGRRAARIGALLFLFAPPSLQRYSLLSLGTHFEGMALGLFVLDEGLRWARDGCRPPRAARLGLAAGFGVYFSYPNAVPVASVALLLALTRGRALLGAPGLALLGGALLGVAPLTWMLASVGTAVFEVHGAAPGFAHPARSLDFVGRVFADATVWTRLAYGTYLTAALLGVALALARTRGTARRAAMALAGACALWLVTWAWSPYVFDRLVYGWFTWLRMAPLVLLLLVLGAVGVERALAGPRWLVALGSACAAAVLLVGAVGTVHIVASGSPGSPLTNLRRLATTKGYDYRGYLPRLAAHAGVTELGQLGPLLAFDEPDRELLWTSLAITSSALSSPDPIEHLDALARLEPEGRAAFQRGLGKVLLDRVGGKVAVALTQLEGLPPKEASAFAEALGYFPGYGAGSLETITADLAHGEGPLGQPYLRGLGARAFRELVMSPYGGALALDPEGVRARLASQPHAAALCAGFDQERMSWSRR